MTIEDFFRMLLRYALLLIVGIVAGAALGYGYSYTQAPVYQANALGYVSSSSQTDDDGNPITQASGNMDLQYAKAQSYLPLFNTHAVGEAVKEELGLPQSGEAIAGSLQASLNPNAPIITVSAHASTSQEASDIANAAVLAAATEALRLETGGNEKARPIVQLTHYQTAMTPTAPVSPDRMRYLMVGAGAGLLLALGSAYLLSRNDQRIRTVEDVERAVGLATLGVLRKSKDFVRPKSGELPEPTSFHARESVRKLRTNLRFADVDSPVRSIVVTSGGPGEGKSTVAGNLARVIARSGQPTLLIDADMRRPVVAKAFGLDGSVGLSHLLVGQVTLADALQPVPNSNLVILPSGKVPPNPSELLGSKAMRQLVQELSQEFFVIIDAPPVLAVTDAQLLSSITDGTLLVAKAGKARATGLRFALDQIEAASGRVLGVVLNGAATRRLSRIAYGDAEYGYGSYGYGYAAYGDDSGTNLSVGVAPPKELPVDGSQIAAAAQAASQAAELTTRPDTLNGPVPSSADLDPVPMSRTEFRRSSGASGQ